MEQVRKDGGRVWCSVSVSAFEHPGRGTVWTSVHTDVTARRAADETLRTADERFQRLFEDSPVGIALVSAELQRIGANPALCAITGFDRGELVGRRLEDIAHPDDASDKLELARRALAGEIPQHRAESRFITKRGDVVNVARTVTVVRGPDQRPAGGLGSWTRSPAAEERAPKASRRARTTRPRRAHPVAPLRKRMGE